MIGHPGDWLSLAAVAHNIFSAGSGAVPGASYLAALGEIFWATSYEDALRAGQYVSNQGGDAELIEEAFKDSFADSMGWSDEEFEQFWKDPSYAFTTAGAGRFDDTWDAWEFMLRR
jgi:hypothetical protein